MISFQDNLSRTIAERFVNLQDCPPPQEAMIRVDGFLGIGFITVVDIILDFTQDLFLQMGAPNEVEGLERVWRELSLSSHSSVMEFLITNHLRRLGCPLDCSYVHVIDHDIARVRFRVSSQLMTQNPAPFFPLCVEMERLQELKLGEWELTTPDSPKNILATWSIVESSVFIAYESYHQIGCVAHLAPQADLNNLFSQIAHALSTYSVYQFDFVLFGVDVGFEQVQQLLRAAGNFSIQLNYLKSHERPYCQEAMLNDISRCVSVRLNRSVALDTTKVNPLNELLSYDPELKRISPLYC